MKILFKYLIIFCVLFFIIVFFMGATRHVILNGNRITGTPKNIIIFLSTLLSNFKSDGEIIKPSVLKSTLTLKNGFNHSENCKDNKDYLLIGVWDNSLNQSVIKLLRISDGKKLYEWIPNIDTLIRRYNFNNHLEKNNTRNRYTIRMVHPFLNSDGSLLFH